MSHRLLYRSGLSLLFVATPVLAQFAQLSATDDGNQLYFTSQLMLRGATSTSASRAPEARLYRYGPDGVTLFAERGSLASQHVSGTGAGVANPQVSGDGSVAGFTFTYVCLTDPQCMSPGEEGEIRGQRTLDAGPGTLQLSHNGRWALLTQTISNLSPGTIQPPTYVSTLMDLTTGQRTDVPPPPYPTARTLASDGTLLVQPSAEPLSLWKQGQTSPIPLPAGLFVNTGSMTLSDDATTLVVAGFFQASIPAVGLPDVEMMTIDVASGNVTTLFTAQDSKHGPVLMAASNNGQVVLFRLTRPGALNGPAYFANAATGQTIAIDLPDGEFVSDGTLTGPGDVAFLVTTGGRIVKATQSTGAIDTLFPATPSCDTTYPVAAGSLTYLACSIIGSASDLQGQILINGTPVPVLSAQGGVIGVQVPWEARGTLNNTLSLNSQSASPFDASQPITVLDSNPQFLAADPGQSSLLGLDIVKGDWSGLLTTQPGPGDIVYVYMTGLGPVRNPVQTGVPASLTTPNPVTGTFACRFQPQKEDAETLFAELAPGMIGIYQVAFRMPADAGAAPITGIACNLQTPGGGSSIGVGTLGGAS